MKTRFVIENSEGQAVRSIDWHASTVVVYLNLNTGRVELCPSIQDLKDTELDFQILADTTVTEIQKSALNFGKSTLRQVDHVDNVVELQILPADSTDELRKISKWTAISHLALLLLMFLGSLLFSQKQQMTEPAIVKVMPQRNEARRTVKVSERRLRPVQQKARVAQRTYKPKVASQLSSRKKLRRTPLRTQVSVSKVGALGALGGSRSGKKGSAGFNINAANSSLGTSLKNVGRGGSGGQSRAVHGRALVTTPIGMGGNSGSGGYATRGKGGGRPGYGSMQTPGGSEGYFLALEEEALIEGGLDKDQIAAIINRHIGQIIYCYEKGLQVEPHLSGRVAVKFVINGGGQVHTAAVSNSSLRSANVEGCILGKLRLWKFPKPYGNVNVKVTYPFVLRRVS